VQLLLLLTGSAAAAADWICSSCCWLNAHWPADPTQHQF